MADEVQNRTKNVLCLQDEKRRKEMRDCFECGKLCGQVEKPLGHSDVLGVEKGVDNVNNSL